MTERTVAIIGRQCLACHHRFGRARQSPESAPPMSVDEYFSFERLFDVRLRVNVGARSHPTGDRRHRRQEDRKLARAAPEHEVGRDVLPLVRTVAPTQISRKPIVASTLVFTTSTLAGPTTSPLTCALWLGAPYAFTGQSNETGFRAD